MSYRRLSLIIIVSALVGAFSVIMNLCVDLRLKLYFTIPLRIFLLHYCRPVHGVEEAEAGAGHLPAPHLATSDTPAHGGDGDTGDDGYIHLGSSVSASGGVGWPGSWSPLQQTLT